MLIRALNNTTGKNTTRIARIKNVPCKAQPISDVIAEQSWVGKRCFLLGGGPSLINFDYSRLDDELTVGINKTFLTYQSTINYSMDETFYTRLTEKAPDKYITAADKKIWKEYEGIRLFLRQSARQAFDESIYYIPAIHRKVFSESLKLGIYGGNNSGFGALMLAITLGCREIYLLGYDFKMFRAKTHWHNGYREETKKQMDHKFSGFFECFEDFAGSIKERGVSVINLNPESNLTCFPMACIDDIIRK